MYNSGWSDRPQSPEQEQEEADGPGQGGSETKLEQKEEDADAVENQPSVEVHGDLEALCTSVLVDSLGWLDGEDLGGAGFTYASGSKERSEVEGAAQEGGEV